MILEIFEIFVFQSRFCPWIRSKFKNRATSCTLSGFVAYSCKFSRLCVRPIVLDASDKLFPQFATVTLKLGQGQKFCSQTVAQGKIFGYAKFCLATLKTLPLRSIRVWKKKNGNADYLNLWSQLRWLHVIMLVYVSTCSRDTVLQSLLGCLS